MSRKVAGAAITAAAIILAGCGESRDTSSLATTTSTASPDQAIANWGADQMFPSFDAIGADFTWIGAAMQGLNFADARAGCRNMGVNVDRLEAKLPTPDAVLTGHVSDMVVNLREFSRYCQGLSPQSTENELSEMSSYRERAQSAMNESVQIVKAAQQASS